MAETSKATRTYTQTGISSKSGLGDARDVLSDLSPCLGLVASFVLCVVVVVLFVRALLYLL